MFPTSIFDEAELEAFPPFTYTPLSSPENTRLIKIRPAWNQEDPIQFTLEEYPITSLPAYTAISYTWQGQKPSRPILCDAKVMLITPNAQDALRRLRPRTHTNERHYLWLDAICIDQSSVSDKNNQVARMADIYRNARCVAAWLGQIDIQDVSARQNISQDNLSKHWDSMHAIIRSRFRIMPASLRKASQELDLWDRAALEILTANEYWTRLWTVQEMAVNPTCKIYIGQHRSIPAANMYRIPLRHIGAAVSHLGSRKSKQRPAENLIDTLLQHNAGEPLDYIYGLRAVFPDVLGSIAVDYDRSANSLFADVAQRILLAGGWKMLYIAHHGSKMNDCPSWVPDWSSPQKIEWMDGTLGGLPSNLPLQAKHGLRFSANGRSMFLSGTIRASVKLSSPGYVHQHPTCGACAARIRTHICDSHLWYYLGVWLEICSSEARAWQRKVYPYMPQRFIPEHYHAMAEILCSPELGPLPSSRRDKMREHIEELGVSCGGWRSLELGNPEGAILDWLSQKHFFLTQGGTMGVAHLPTGLEAGDFIVRFTPLMQYFAVRPVVVDGDTKYELLGWVRFVDMVKDDPNPNYRPGETEIFELI